MQCPRCGADNPPGVSACIRCGLMAYPGPHPYAAQPRDPYAAPPQHTYAPQPPDPYAGQTQRPIPPPPSGAQGSASAPGRSVLATVAAVVTVLAALASLGYGIFALTARRGVYADIAESASSVSFSDAEGNDRLNSVLLWVAVVLVLLAVVLWLVASITARRGADGLGLTGLALVVLGAAPAVVGAVLVNGVGTATEAESGAAGYILVGVGFLVAALGLMLGTAALRQAGSRPPASGSASFPDGQDPYGNRYPPYGSPYGGQPLPGPYGGSPDPGPPYDHPSGQRGP